MDVDESTPAEVFELVGHETRLEILRALLRAYAESPFDPWVDYSELREEVGIRDKGNFNYHLDRLDELIVRESEGYLISGIGLEVVSTVASGTLDPDWSWGPIDAPGDCLFCERSVTLRYEDGGLLLECPVDDHTLLFPVAPSLLAGSGEEAVLERIATLLYHQFALARRGICWDCQGPVDGELRRWADESHYYFHGNCRRCGVLHGFTAGTSVLSHPVVVSFFDERGVDVRSTPFWTLECCGAGRETILSTDPLRLRVDVEFDGDGLSLTLDREATVVSVDREFDD